MIREQRDNIAAIAEHLLSKSLQRLLRPNFYEHSRARIVERAQPPYELHGASDLLREQVQHLRNNIRARGIKLAIHVGDDWHTGWLYMQVRKYLTQGLAGRGDNRRVESMADRQRPYVVASLQEDLHGLFDCFTGAADDRL